MKERGDWNRRPARPIRYGAAAARTVDWWNAHCDARAGLPALDGAQPARRFTYTPKLERLRHRAADAIEHELLRLEQERAAPARALAAVREQVPMAQTVAAAARSALSDASRPLDETELDERRAGESRTDAAVVRKRRQLAHDKRVADREATLDAAERELLRLRSTEADLVESIRRSELVAAARARRIHEHPGAGSAPTGSTSCAGTRTAPPSTPCSTWPNPTCPAGRATT